MARPMNPDRLPEVVLEARGLRKSYGAITAVDGVDLQIRRGEILAVVGDNGAGKSTVVKMLCGAVRPDAGDLFLDGQAVSFPSPAAARARGVETVFQDLALVPNRDVVANLFLGRELLYGGVLRPLRLLNRPEMRRRAADQLAQLEVNVPRATGLPIGRMSGGQRQAVAIARAAFWASRVMFMDEPTAALGVRESKAVLRLARRVADQGVAVVMVSHALPHVVELADRAVVMRHGIKVADLARVTDVRELIDLILGAELAHAGGAQSAGGEEDN